jgi:GT2 family glycosyltransferase
VRSVASAHHETAVDVVTPTWAVIPTKNRSQLVHNLLESLRGQVDAVVIVDNNDTRTEVKHDGVAVYNEWHPGYPPNLSRLYNVGMDYATTCMRGVDEWNLVLLNDDVVCPPGWVESLSDAMRASPAVMAFTDRLGRATSTLYTQPPTNPYDTCMVAACMLRGELCLRFDEEFLWWYGDTDLDYRCRQSGGVIAVPGPVPEHLHPSAQTVADPNLTAQTHRDRETFAHKWQGVPW